jgi:hypothetical protein
MLTHVAVSTYKPSERIATAQAVLSWKMAQVLKKALFEDNFTEISCDLVFLKNKIQLVS